MLCKVECSFTVVMHDVYDLQAGFIVESLDPDGFYDQIIKKGATVSRFYDRKSLEFYYDYAGLVELPERYLEEIDLIDYEELENFLISLFDKGEFVVDCVADIGGLDYLSVGRIDHIAIMGEDVIMRHNGLCQDMFISSGPGLVPNPEIRGDEMSNFGEFLGIEEKDELEVLADEIEEEIVSNPPPIVEKAKGIQSVVEQLVQLRKEGNAVHMEAASIFNEVKESKSFKAEFKSFGEFTQSTGWARQYVYDLIKIYNCEALREAFVDIGALKAIKIYQAYKDSPDEMKDAIEFAREASGKEVQEYIKDNAPGDNSPEDSQEESPLVKLGKLETEKARLEARLAEILIEMAEIAKKVEASAK